MRIADVSHEALLQYRCSLLAGIVLAVWPVTVWAETATPPPSPLRNPLSGVTRFLGPQSHESGMGRTRAPSSARREAQNHVVRKATPQPAPAYAYRYAYVGYYHAYPRYYYPYTNAAWAGYPYRRCDYYYSPIPGFAGH